jgi:hypothetical protein
VAQNWSKQMTRHNLVFLKLHFEIQYLLGERKKIMKPVWYRPLFRKNGEVSIILKWIWRKSVLLTWNQFIQELIKCWTLAFYNIKYVWGWPCKPETCGMNNEKKNETWHCGSNHTAIKIFTKVAIIRLKLNTEYNGVNHRVFIPSSYLVLLQTRWFYFYSST